MLSKADLIAVSSYNKINHWNYKLKKLLYFHLKLLTPGRDSFATPLRMIELFTSDTLYKKHIQSEKISDYLIDVSFHPSGRHYNYRSSDEFVLL